MTMPERERPVTAALAIQALELLQLPPIKPGTIRTWAARGKVRRYGLNQDGHMQYELQDIVDATRKVTT